MKILVLTLCLGLCLAQNFFAGDDEGEDPVMRKRVGKCAFLCEELETGSLSCLGDFKLVCNGKEDCQNGADEMCAPRCDPADVECLGLAPPGGLDPSEVPQMILLSTEDYLIPYSGIFQRRPDGSDRTNPNGCPIKATWFLPHEYTNYAVVQELYARGHEIASLSISHRLPALYWSTASEQEWREEIDGHRVLLQALAGVDPGDVLGMRAPYLQMGGDTQMKVLQDNNFLWDSSMASLEPVWPFKFDRLAPVPCDVPPCPIREWTDLWEIPIIKYYDGEGVNRTTCEQLDSCVTEDPKTADDWYNLIKYNFDRHFDGNRSPFHIIVRPGWFANNAPAPLRGLAQFLDEVMDNPRTSNSVYFVTMQQAVRWMSDPTPLSNIRNFAPWGCPDTGIEGCGRDKGTVFCQYFNLTLDGYTEFQFSRGMTLCNNADTSCPPFYPWVRNPDGQGL